MTTPSEIFEGSIETLREQYSERRFEFEFERDVVEAVKLQVVSVINQKELPYQVHKEFRVIPTEGMRADLVITNGSSVELAAEFKFEPSRKRHQEFSKGKFPVVDWKCVLDDVERVKNYVRSKDAKIAYSVFIDEGSYFSRRKEAPRGSEWRHWDNGVSVLWCEQKA